MHTKYSKCPVTNTYTVGKSTSLEYTHTLSTIYETITTTVPVSSLGPAPGHGGFNEYGGPKESVVVGTSSFTEVEYQTSVVSKILVGSPVPNVPAGGSPKVYSLVTKTIVPVPSSAYIPSGNTEAASYIPGTHGKIGYNPIGANEVPSSVAPGSPGTTETVSTIIPGAPGYSPSAATEAGSSVPFTVGNSTVGVPTGTSGSVPAPTYSGFTGAATKMGAGVMTTVMVAVAVVVML